MCGVLEICKVDISHRREISQHSVNGVITNWVTEDISRVQVVPRYKIGIDSTVKNICFD